MRSPRWHPAARLPAHELNSRFLRYCGRDVLTASSLCMTHLRRIVSTASGWDYDGRPVSRLWRSALRLIGNFLSPYVRRLTVSLQILELPFELVCRCRSPHPSRGVAELR